MNKTLLNLEQRNQARKMRTEGWRMAPLARRFRVSQPLMRNIISYYGIYAADRPEALVAIKNEMAEETI